MRGVAAQHLQYLIECSPFLTTRYLYEPVFHAGVFKALELLDRTEDFLGVEDALALVDYLHDKLAAS